MEHATPPIFLVLVAAALAPLIGMATARFGLSIVVIELLLGVAIGPQGLALVHPSAGMLTPLATFGMVFLFFIAGLEIDLDAIRGRPLLTAVAAWAIALGLGAAVGVGLSALGLTQSWRVVAIALATTALGVLVPILRDAGIGDKPFGLQVLANGVVGELGPIVLMSVLLSSRYSSGTQAELTLAFAALVLVLAWLIARGAKVPALLRPLRRGLDHSGQLPVRIVLVLIGGLAVAAELFGLDLALGALAAGMITGLATRGGARTADLHSKIDALGFGFVVPMFFLVSGMKLDVRSMFTDTEGITLLAVFFVALLVVRLPTVWLLRGALGTRQAAATALLSATTLSLIVVLAQVAVAAGAMAPAEAAPLVGAGMLSVIVFPIIGMKLAGVERPPSPADTARDGL
ncbi:MAG: cation:proton antiporter [Burkholderiales bacterium]